MIFPLAHDPAAGGDPNTIAFPDFNGVLVLICIVGIVATGVALWDWLAKRKKK